MGAAWIARLEKLSHRLLGAHVGLGASPVRRMAHGWHPELDQTLRGATFVVFDVETTGLRPGRDRIVSLGAVRFTHGTAEEREASFSRLVNPEAAIPEASTRIHGITQADVAGEPPLRELLPEFRAFVGDAVPVVHHAEFDLAFLARPLARAGLPSFVRVLDTLLLGEVLLGPPFNGTLDSLAALLGVPTGGRHTALGDARISAEALRRLLPRVEAAGAVTLGAALILQRGDAALYPRRGRHP